MQGDEKRPLMPKEGSGGTDVFHRPVDRSINSGFARRVSFHLALPD
jgi:hypothetical protein